MANCEHYYGFREKERFQWNILVCMYVCMYVSLHFVST
jgi:hypothetical protein